MSDLEPLDQYGKKEPSFEVIDEQKEAISSVFYTLLFLGFIVVFAIKMYQSWPTTSEQKWNAINNRQVILLEQMQGAKDSIHRKALAIEYDSLSMVLRQIEE